MRLSEIIRSIRPATFAEKSLARIAGVSGGVDVSLPYLQSGWVNVADSQYTAGSPLAITGGVRTQLTINGLGATTNKLFANGMPQDVWSDNRFKPSDIGECYNLRLTATVTQAQAGSGHHVTFEADIGTEEAPFIAASQSIPLNKGNGVPSLITISAPFFTLGTFGLNGARLFLTPSVNVTVHSMAIFIQRTFKP
mgnify:FL=1